MAAKTYLDIIANAFSEARAWKFTSLVLAAVSAVLLAALIYESRNAPVVLVPYNFATESGRVKVDPGARSDVSPDYVAQIALGDLAIILNWTPDNIELQYQRFLNRTTEELFAAQNVKLMAQAAENKASGITQSFYPKDVRFAPGKNEVTVTGQLVRWSGEKETVRTKIEVVITYKLYRGFLHVDDIKLK